MIGSHQPHRNQEAPPASGADAARRYEAIIFDLDGTLADTLVDLTDALNITLAEAGAAPMTPEQVRPMVGRGFRDLLRQALALNDEPRIDALKQVFRAAYRVHMLRTTRLYPGIAEMLTELSRMGVCLAVLSNKSHEFTISICKALLGPWPFRAFRGAGDGYERKPDPAGAMELAGVMNVPADDVLLVGDSATDAETARNAGMDFAGATWGYRSEAELRDAGARVLIRQPRELIRILS